MKHPIENNVYPHDEIAHRYVSYQKKTGNEYQSNAHNQVGGKYTKECGEDMGGFERKVCRKKFPAQDSFRKIIIAQKPCKHKQKCTYDPQCKQSNKRLIAGQ
jgi:hypothetical protein